MICRREFLKRASLLSLTSVLWPELTRSLETSASTRLFFDLNPVPENQPVIDWLRAEGWCWGLGVPWSVPETRLRELTAQEWNLVLHMIAHPETRQRHAEYKKRAAPDPDKVLQRWSDTSRATDMDFIWMMLLENDSAGVAHPQKLLETKPKSHHRALNLLTQHLQEAHQTAAGYHPVQKWGVAGYAPSCHAFAASGLDCVIIERANDDVEDLLTGLSFCRGAASQYNISWGVDISLWWGPIYGCIQALPDNYHRRHLYTSYFSGARTFRIEGGDLFYDRKNKQLQPLAKMFNEFGRFTQAVDPGKPDVPLGIVLPADHGWMTPPYWRTTRTAWNYARIPYRRGQRALDGFFATAFPGSRYAMQPFPFGKYEQEDPPASPFALSCITPEFSPHPEDVFYQEPPLPWGKYKNRKEARQQMQAEQIDPALARPMPHSRWGGGIDVILKDSPLNVLQRYPMLMIFDSDPIEHSFKQTLLQYVGQGGILILASGVVGPEDTDLTGIRFIPEYRQGRSWQPANKKRMESFLYLPVSDINEKTRAVFTTGSGDPLVTCHDLGQGQVYTSLLPWFESEKNDFSEMFAELMDQLFAQYSKLYVAGEPLQWITTCNGREHYAFFSNNSHEAWEGEIRFNHDKPVFDYFERNQTFPEKRFTIAPFDLKILRWPV